MFQTIKNAWRTPDIRKKLLFTLMILLLYRIGANLVVPYVDVSGLSENLEWANKEGLFAMFNLLSGSAFTQGTFFALSVSPYITASIVMQLLTIAIKPLEELSKQGDEGRKKITMITRFVTVGLAIITAIGYVELLESESMLTFGSTKVWFAKLVMIASLCAGAAVIMWLAELINAHGIGNGISMILFANIVSGFTTTAQQMVYMLKDTNSIISISGVGVDYAWKTGWDLVGAIVAIVVSVALAIAAIVLIVWFTNSERRIPIQYAKRVVGRKMYGGQSSNLPLKMNMAGVMPVIFASSIVSILPTIAGFFPSNGKFATWVANWFNYDTIPYLIVFSVLIFLFSYFYIMISFNPIEVANNIRSNGGSVPGIRPGKPTSDYIKKILNRITTFGAVFLLIIAGLPMLVNVVISVINEATGASLYFTSLAFMGTSLLIVVGVALETVRDIEAQLTMRNYKGFLD